MGKFKILVLNKKALAEYNRKIYEDALTGAYNRNYLKDELAGKKISALAMIDVDHFKVMNDTYGHMAGDEVLRKVVSLIQEELYPGDALIRFGGDELLLVFGKKRKHELTQLLGVVRRKVDEYVFTEYSGVHVTLSIGACECRHLDQENLRRADQMLYEAKKERNCVKISRRGM